ncbi:MAG: ATP-dependent DNA helicase RecG [bacterium]
MSRFPPMITLYGQLDQLPGIGPKTAQFLANLGIRRPLDLLNWFPRSWEDLTRLSPISAATPNGEKFAFKASLKSISTFRSPVKRMFIAQAVLSDATGSLKAIWFNQPYLRTSLKAGQEYYWVGKVEPGRAGLTLMNPSFEPADRLPIHSGKIIPVYPATADISTKIFRRLIHPLLPLARTVEDYLPAEWLAAHNLLPLGKALHDIHSPATIEQLNAARKRLGFEELLITQLSVQTVKRFLQQQVAQPIPTDQAFIDKVVAQLPYSLTAGQTTALQEILADIAQSRPTNRLLMGDVGSGKTIVIAIAMLQTAKAGFQSALMAPTEVLAEQHFRTLSPILREFGIDCALRTQTNQVGGPDADVIIGTHALIQSGAQFPNLNLVVVDEQHRFGVKQREALKHKSYSPHFLSLTATPIPRSLALTALGDLDISVIPDRPKDRLTIKSFALAPADRGSAYQTARKQIEAGHQVFVVAPLIEDSESVSSTSATAEFQRVKQLFPAARVGLLHGRLSGEAKQTVMGKFARGELDILVSTTVIEVGIDVPNATVMIIEGAERFGLAQLHQLRGRVGRAEHQSFCFVIPTRETVAVAERLKLFAGTSDGFKLAELDLTMRGPGNLFGYSQSGFLQYRLADWTDAKTVAAAQAVATDLLNNDPDLTRYPQLKEQLDLQALTTHQE